MKVSAVVISHGHREELASSLPALVPQVDEMLVIANLPGSEPADPLGARVIENARPRSFAANINAGVAATIGRARARLQSRRGARAGGRRGAPRVHGGAPALRHRGAAAPRPGRRVAAVPPPLPDRQRHPRPPHAAAPPAAAARAPARALPPRRAAEEPVRADWMLGGCLLFRRSMLDELGGFDEGFRMYGEEIDLCYRAARAGWECWYVPAAVARHRWDAETDKSFFTRRTLWHWRGMLRYVRKHPESLGPCDDREVRRTGGRLDDAAYADPQRYLRHRAELVVALGPRSSPETRCSTSHAATRGSRRRCSRRAPLHGRRPLRADGRGGAAAARRPDRRRRGDLNDYAPPGPVACTTCFRALYYARDRRAFFRHVAVVHREEARLRPQSAPVPRWRASLADLRAAGLGAVALPPVLLAAAGRGYPARCRRASRRRAVRPAGPRAAPPPLHLHRRRRAALDRSGSRLRRRARGGRTRPA